MVNAVFGKAMKNVRKYIIIKFVKMERRRNYLVSELNYQLFKEHFLAIKMEKSRDTSTIGLRKILMYEFWYDYVKLKNVEKAKLCYMDTVGKAFSIA